MVVDDLVAKTAGFSGAEVIALPELYFEFVWERGDVSFPLSYKIKGYLLSCEAIHSCFIVFVCDIDIVNFIGGVSLSEGCSVCHA